MQDARKPTGQPIGYEVLGGLNRLFADALELISSIWTTQFEVQVDLGLELASVRSFRQFAYAQQPPFNLLQLRNRADHTSWWLVIQSSAASALLDLLLGSKHAEWESLPRPLNAIESELLTPLCEEIIHVIEDVWRPVTELDLSVFQWFQDLPEIETDLEELLDVEMVCLKWRLTIGSHQSQMGLCLPAGFVLAWAKKLIQHHYGELPLEPQYEAVVEFSTGNVDLSQLEVGGVIETGHSPEKPLKLTITNGDQHQVRLGAKDGMKAFQIVE